jgi:heterogeneous nuclear ribonucleoprotein F/H
MPVVVVSSSELAYATRLAATANTLQYICIAQGCELVDFFCVNRQGRFSGDAFVVLGSEQQVAAALAKDRSSMGRRYIEVYKARRAVRQQYTRLLE